MMERLIHAAYLSRRYLGAVALLMLLSLPCLCWAFAVEAGR